MSSPQDDPDLRTSLLEASYMGGSVRESVNAMGLIQGPLLWESVFSYGDRKDEPKDLQVTLPKEDRLEAWGEILHSVDLACEKTKFEVPGLGGDFSRNGLQEALLGLHKLEGLFNLSSEAVARCLHLACVICLNSLLVLVRIELQNMDAASEIVRHSDLTDEVSKLSKKWSWPCGNSWKEIFGQWINYIGGAADAEEAMRLLYQWTFLPVQAAIHGLVRVNDDANVGGGNDYAEVSRVSKLADAQCHFLEECRALFKPSADTEFLYFEMYTCYHRAALLHRTLSNHKQRRILLDDLAKMLEGIHDDNLKVPNWEKGKISYRTPDPMTIIGEMGEVMNLLKFHGCDVDWDPQELHQKLNTGSEWNGLRPGHHCGFLGWHTTHFEDEIVEIINLLGDERFREAGEILEQLDLNEKRLNASFHEFLERVVCHSQNFVHHTHLRTPLTWQSFCKKLDFFLEVCEALGDPQLTAQLLLQYGMKILTRSLHKLSRIWNKAAALKLRLIEELDLQPSFQFPECIQELISCVSDPCKSDEHKRDSLPDTLKGLRLLKRSIDIYSDLHHNWTDQGSSNEGEWLKVLGSKDLPHGFMQHSLLSLMKCCMISMGKSDSSVATDDEQMSRHGAILGSNHSNRVINFALNCLLKSSLVWAERGRARTLLYQLGPWYDTKHDVSNQRSLKRELIEFDNNHEAARSSILSCRLICKQEPLYIEYVTQPVRNGEGTDNLAFLIHKQYDVRGVHFQTKEGEVEELIDSFYDTVPLQHRSNSASVVVKLHDILEKLYDILIKPLSEDERFKHLDSRCTLIFVPDKMLYKVPFALLRDRNTKKYLFQLHPIAIAPSLRVMQHCEQRFYDIDKFPLKPEGCILAVGNVTYKENRMIFGTGKELEHLRLFFPGHVKTLENDDATRAKFVELVKEVSDSTEPHAFAFIHLGVHGHWKLGEDGEYMTGSLQFAKVPEQTGISKMSSTDTNNEDLRAGQSYTSLMERSEAESLEKDVKQKQEIENERGRHGNSAFGEVGVTRTVSYSSSSAEDMLSSEDILNGGFQWRTRLVVLSACNSLRGEDYSDGEVNLPRVLMIAGVPAIVVSQWKVDDCISPQLMELLYKNLRHGLDVAMALQSAMLQLSNPESELEDNIFAWGPFLVWGLPTVQLPEELLTENARKALPTKRLVDSLSCLFNHFEDNEMKKVSLTLLEIVYTFLKIASSTACVPEEEAIVDAIIALENLLMNLQGIPLLSAEAIALVEEFYTTYLPLEQLERVELELEKRHTTHDQLMLNFRDRMLYMQARKGNHQIALDYANALLEAIQNAMQAYHESSMQALEAFKLHVKLERGVILRLLGEYTEALKEFDDILAHGEDYGCLIQTSFLKDLMADKSGALEYARQAKILEGDAKLDKHGNGVSTLAFQELPDDYRDWLLDIDVGIKATLSSTRNARKVIDAKHQSLKLRDKFSNEHLQYCTIHKVELLKALDTVDDFLAADHDNACLLEDKAIIHAIIAAEQLLALSNVPSISKDIVALVEHVYLVDLPDEQLRRVEQVEFVSMHFWDQSLLQLTLRNMTDSSSVELDMRGVCEVFTIVFRTRMMYMQAMKGNHRIALDYANMLVEVIQSACGCDYTEFMMQKFRNQEMIVKRERGVIFRLMGMYEEALREFDDLLTAGENYECLVQTSILKYLMKDKSGALEYAHRAIKGERPDSHMVGYGAFTLGVKVIPNEYCKWLLTVEGKEGSPLHFVWDTHWQGTEKARSALVAKQQMELLRNKCNRVIPENMKVKLLRMLDPIDTFWDSASCNACVLGEEAIIDAIIAIEQLLVYVEDFGEMIALGEEFYTVLPFQQLTRIEPQLERRSNEAIMCGFRTHVMYVQAIQGNHQIALDYANILLEDVENALRCEYDTSIVQDLKLSEMFFKQERAVMWRLMGKYKEALKEFDEILAVQEDYECLIQSSYLKHLMKDENGALKYAIQAKKLRPSLIEPSYGAFALGVKALPDEYHQWLMNIDESTEASSSSANQPAMVLRCKLDDVVDNDIKASLLNDLHVVDTFLASAYNALGFEEEAVVGTVVAIEQLLSGLKTHPQFAKEVIALGEEIYTILSFNHRLGIELLLEENYDQDGVKIFNFRQRVMYTHAMEGSHQIALEYAIKMIEVVQNECNGDAHYESTKQSLKEKKMFHVRREKAVILRLMGEYEEALKEFDDLLVFEENYQCLIQASYLKNLMKDKSGALDYAHRAKNVLSGMVLDWDVIDSFVLATKALPNEYRQWLLNIDSINTGATSSPEVGNNDLAVNLAVNIVLELEPLFKAWAQDLNSKF